MRVGGGDPALGIDEHRRHVAGVGPGDRVGSVVVVVDAGVTVARSILDHVFAIVGVRPDCRDELALAVTEACGNAVRHADGVSTYALTAESNERECTITIADDGPGIAENLLTTMPPPSAKGGRGFALMRITTDALEFHRRPSGGLAVLLRKRLRWHDDAFGQERP
jgi:serine/threonine-protein kinase RsbW